MANVNYVAIVDNNGATRYPVSTDALTGDQTKATNITSGSDFNDLTTAGNYIVPSAAIATTLVNRPSDFAGRLFVMHPYNTERVFQFYFDGGDNSLYFRLYTTAWRAWQKLCTESTADTKISTALSTALSDYFALSAEDSTTIPDNTDINTILTPGTYKITNNTHAGTMTNLPTALACKILVFELTQANRVMQFLFPVSVAAVVYFRYYNGTTWTDWMNWAKAGVVNDLISDVNKRENLKILYESGSYASGKATERISVYIPSESGYIMYRLYHFVDNSIKCNTWQIYHVYHVDDNLENMTDLSVTGEWECAIHLANRSDFSGGNTHGDEIMNNSVLLIDGVPTALSSLTSLTECREIRLIRTSKMYDPSSETTEIADHGVEYVFNTESMTVNQSLKWLVAETLTNCFMAMFLPSKNHIDRAVVNSDFEVLTLASSTSESTTSVVKAGGSAITMWDTSTGFSADVSVPVYPTGLTGGDSMSISDNDGGNYNKVYFRVCNSGISSVGELWKSKAVYKLGYKAV